MQQWEHWETNTDDATLPNSWQHKIHDMTQHDKTFMTLASHAKLKTWPRHAWITESWQWASIPLHFEGRWIWPEHFLVQRACPFEPQSKSQGQTVSHEGVAVDFKNDFGIRPMWIVEVHQLVSEVLAHQPKHMMADSQVIQPNHATRDSQWQPNTHKMTSAARKAEWNVQAEVQQYQKKH